MKKFVIVVDAQFDFIDPQGKLYIKGAQAVITPINSYLESLTTSNCVGVLFTLDTHETPEYLASSEHIQSHFPIHCEKGTCGHQLVVDVDKINIDIPVYTLEKSVFDMWVESNLRVKSLRGAPDVAQDRDAFFQAMLTSNISEIVVMGVASDYCVMYTLEGLLKYNLNIKVLSLGTCGINQDINEIVKYYFQSNELISLI